MEYDGRLNIEDFKNVTKKWVPQAIVSDILMYAGAFFAIYLMAHDGFHIPSLFTPLSFWLTFSGFTVIFLFGFIVLSIIFPRHYMLGAPLKYRWVFGGLALSLVGGTGAFLVFVSALPVFSMGMWALAYALYWIRVLGITVGYHRFATHRAFKAGKAFVRIMFGGGSTARQQKVRWWGGNHLIHHDRTEIESQDPHTPRQSPFKFFHAHIEWIWYQFVYPDSIWYAKQYCRGLEDNPLVKEQDKYYWQVMILGFILPALIFGPLGLWSGGEFSAMNGLWEGFKAFSLGLLFFVVSFNVTMTVNSWSHTWGPKYYVGKNTGDSTDPFYLALFSAGENLQNIHHLMDFVACYWVDWKHPDYSGAIIVGLERLGRFKCLEWLGLPYELETIDFKRLEFMKEHTIANIRGGYRAS